MAITDYTTCTAIRAVLGVSDDEVEDAIILLPLYEVMLQEDLLGMASTLQADYTTVKAIVNPTAIEARFVRICQTYAAYQVAYTLLGSVTMFAPKDIKDGKAGVMRVDEPFIRLEASVIAALSYIRTRLLASYELYSPTNPAPASVTRKWIAGAVLALDPVVG